MVDTAHARPRLRTLALGLAVLLAGCGGYFETSTSTVTPVPVPEPPTVAPGVPESGAVDSGRLLAADRAARRGEQVRIVDVMTVQGPGQQFTVRRAIERRGPDRVEISYLYTRGQYVEPLFVGETRNGSGRFVRTTLPNGTQRINTSLPPPLRPRLPPEDLTERVLASGDFELLEGTERVLRLGPQDSLSLRHVAPPAFRRPSDGSALIKVTPEGRITWVSVDFEAVHRNGSVTVTILRDVRPLRFTGPEGTGGPASPAPR